MEDWKVERELPYSERNCREGNNCSRGPKLQAVGSQCSTESPKCRLASMGALGLRAFKQGIMP